MKFVFPTWHKLHLVLKLRLVWCLVKYQGQIHLLQMSLHNHNSGYTVKEHANLTQAIVVITQ
jgi:hypothetical protein